VHPVRPPSLLLPDAKAESKAPTDFIGGLVPLLPYFFLALARTALLWSIGITTIVLLVFGAFKTYYTGASITLGGYVYGCLSTLAVGGAAAGASFGIVKALEGGGL
jgi:VIT1/CCC1 family predicted Fe2+/Mn2+ transporter